MRATRSVFSDEKKLSIAALSQTLPDLLMEQVTPCSAISRWNCSLLYWVDSGGCRNTVVEGWVRWRVGVVRIGLCETS